jgi:hypothetical protein
MMCSLGIHLNEVSWIKYVYCSIVWISDDLDSLCNIYIQYWRKNELKWGRGLISSLVYEHTPEKLVITLGYDT